MRIAHIAPLIERVPPKKYGGTERVVHMLTEELVTRGHDVTLFASGDSVTSAKLDPNVPRNVAYFREYVEPQLSVLRREETEVWISTIDTRFHRRTLEKMAKAVAYGMCAIIFLGLFLSAPFASAQTLPAADIQSLVKKLQEQIQALQVQVHELKSQLAATKEEVAVTKLEVADVKEELQLTKFLRRGERGDDVRKLQEFLAQFPNLYPSGLTTGFYGPATEAAVRKFQQKHGFEQVGFLGPKTLSKINELINEGAGESGVIPPGLVRAPGLERKDEIAYPIAPPPLHSAGIVPGGSASTTAPVATTTVPAIPVVVAATSSSATTTPAETISAQPAASSATPPVVSPLSFLSPTTGTTTATTTAVQDTMPPTISNVQVANITETSVTIIWTTNESASSKSSYALSSLTSATSTIKVSGASDVTSHSVSLTGLSSGKTHYYVVVSGDASGNTATSSEQTFITLSPPPPSCSFTSGVLTDYTHTSPPTRSAWSIALDSDRDGYVASVPNAKELIKITRNGQISTLATGTERFFGVAVNGNEYLASDDKGNLMKITLDGTVSVRLSQIPITSGFSSDLVMDGADVIMTDYAGRRLLRIKPDNTVAVIATGIMNPQQVVVDNDYYYVSAQDPSTSPSNFPVVFKISRTGDVLVFAKLYYTNVYGGIDASGGGNGILAKVGNYFYTSRVKITNDGAVTWCADSPGQLGSGRRMINDSGALIITSSGTGCTNNVCTSPIYKVTPLSDSVTSAGRGIESPGILSMASVLDAFGAVLKDIQKLLLRLR